MTRVDARRRLTENGYVLKRGAEKSGTEGEPPTYEELAEAGVLQAESTDRPMASVVLSPSLDFLELAEVRAEMLPTGQIVKRDRKGRFSKQNAPGVRVPDLDVGGQADGSSPDRAIDVGSDVDRAAQLLAEGKHVKLSQPREVSTLLDRLAEIVADAKLKGEEAPVYDLCKVSVPGTNLFCAETKGIERAQMPQLSGVPTPGSKADSLPKDDKGEVNLGPLFVEHLKSKGIEITLEEERADHLRASQNQLNGAKVAGMANYLATGAELPGAEEGIFVSESGYVIDGHHRWAAKVGVDAMDGVMGDVTMPVRRIHADIIDLLREANEFAAEWGIPQAAVGQQRPQALTLGEQIGVTVIDGISIPVISVEAADATLAELLSTGQFVKRDRLGRFSG